MVYCNVFWEMEFVLGVLSSKEFKENYKFWSIVCRFWVVMFLGWVLVFCFFCKVVLVVCGGEVVE